MNWRWHIAMALAVSVCSTWIFGGAFIIWMQFDASMGPINPNLQTAFIVEGIGFIIGGLFLVGGWINCWWEGSR